MLFDSKRRYKRRIEKRAIKELGVIKTRENHYLIPSSECDTNRINIDFKNNKIYKDNELIESIKKIPVRNNERIVLSCMDILDDGRKVISVGSVKINDYGEIVESVEIYEFIINSELEQKDRDNLVNMVAYFHRDKDIEVIFFLLYDFKLLEEYIESLA